MRYLVIALGLLIGCTTSANAGYKEVFAKNFLSTPWAGLQEERSACVECHTSDIMDQELREVPQAWQMSWHFQNAVSCHDCHGGDPSDATMSMSHQRGFIGVPTYQDIPELCGKCHIAIKESYYKSGHGKALSSVSSAVQKDTMGIDCGGASGPNCVTCHGSHDIQKASIDIITETKCSKCHPYERAKIMKMALFEVENKLSHIEKQLNELKNRGIVVEAEEQTFFRTHSAFRALFHSIDVELIKTKTDEYAQKLENIQARINAINHDLAMRRNFSAFIFLLFSAMCILCVLFARCVKGRCD